MLMKLNAARTGKEPDQSFRQDRSDRNFQSRREGEFIGSLLTTLKVSNIS